MEKTSVPGGACRRSGRSPSSSQAAAQRSSRPSSVGLSGTRGRSGRWGRHDRVTVPGCCASTTPQRARSARSSCAPRARCRCTSAARPSTTCPTSATAATTWSSTCCAATCSSAGSTCATCPTSPTSTTTSSSGRASRAGPSPRWRPSSRRAGGRPWTRWACCAPTTSRTPRPTSPTWWSWSATSWPAAWPTRRPTASTSTSTRSPGYGLLARQSLDSLRAGARVGGSEEKRSPLDFALWKKAKAGRAEPGTSPWGAGRPGWHTECVVMSLDLLGDGFDLHGGGQDLAFPHHENERAQAVADGRAFARHWVHNGWVEVEGTKMSKSLGNFTSLTDLLARMRRPGLPPAGAAGALPLAHRGDGADTLADAEKALDRLDGLARRFGESAACSARRRRLCGRGRDAGDADPGALAAFHARMDDDLDTPGALAGIFELVTAAHSRRRRRRRGRGGPTGPHGRRAGRRAGRAAAGGRCRGRRGVGSAGGGARRGPPRPRTSPGPTPCGTSWWPGGGRSRTPRPAPPSAADAAENSIVAQHASGLFRP